MPFLRPLILAGACALLPALAIAQTPAAPDPDKSDPDVRVDALQPDFNLVALPTTLRVPVHKWAFRVTHRFTRSLGQGDFSDLASDFFGFDSAAQIGLEVRYGLATGTQIGVHRTSDRSIQIFGQHNFMNERAGGKAGLDLISTLEGQNNLKTHYQSALGLVVSKYLGRYASVYAEPIVVFNTNPRANQGSDNNTFMTGLGTRVRVRPSMYLTAEYTPRFSGIRAWRRPDQLRARRTRGRAPLPVQRVERLRHHAGAACRERRVQQRQLVHRVQHRAEVLLTRLRAGKLPARYGEASRCEKEKHVTLGFRILATHTAAVAALAAMAACGGSSNPAGPSGGGGAPLVGSSGSVGAVGATITIANNAVSPSTVTIAVGQSVTFVNSDSRTHQMQSDPHPAHTDCPSINNVALLSPGQSKTTFGFSGAGTCGFHDHNDSENGSLRGRIVIQ